MTLTTEPTPSIDLRDLPRTERHPRIFGMLNMLSPGQTMSLVVDHDPVPLHHHLETMFAGQFGWQYLERGPDLWRVEIERLKEEGCNCNCGGGH